MDIVFKKLSFILALALVLPACHQDKMRKSAVFNGQKDDVELRVEKLSTHESTRQFGKDLCYYGHQPLRLTIKNNTDDMLLVRASAIGLPLEPIGQVIDDAQMPVLGLTLPSAYLAAIFFWPALVPVVGAGSWMGYKNHEFACAIARQALAPQSSFEILPYERVIRFAFVPAESCADIFSMHLYNTDQKSFILFQVLLA